MGGKRKRFGNVSSMPSSILLVWTESVYLDGAQRNLMPWLTGHLSQARAQ